MDARTIADTAAGPQPMQIGAIRAMRNTDQGWDETQCRISRVSALTTLPPHVMQKLRRKNSCFYYQKQGHVARNCLKKKADLAKQREA